MELRHLKSFIVVAELGSIGRAAVRLHISQPPLTRQIHQLEEQVGAQLLVRTARGVHLTDAGRMFLEEARNIVALTGLAAERAHQAGEGKLGRIDIGIFGSAIFGTIPRMLSAYRQQYPMVNVVLHSMTKGEQIAALRERRLNVGFNRLLERTPDIACELIAMERIYLAVSRRNPLSRQKAVPWRALADHPLILFPSGSRPSFIDWVLDICRKEGFRPQVAQEVGDAVNGVALVASDFGLCLVPESATNLRIPGVVYRPLLRTPPPEVDLSCIYRAGDDSPILRSFLEIARRQRPSGG
jgi:LysR family transcriptional regulator, benzoate and cis,cis-muconate-responsive activator of ben and cat genes